MLLLEASKCQRKKLHLPSDLLPASSKSDMTSDPGVVRNYLNLLLVERRSSIVDAKTPLMFSNKSGKSDSLLTITQYVRVSFPSIRILLGMMEDTKSSSLCA